LIVRLPIAWFPVVVGLLLPIPLSAQTAEELDQALGSPAVSYGQASYFILRSALSGEEADVSPSGAFAIARNKGWVPKGAAEQDTASLGAVSLLVMRAFDLQGGLMYRLFHRPRHAARELVYLKLLESYSDPARPVSGDRLFRLLSGVLARNPQDQALGDEAWQVRMEPVVFRPAEEDTPPVDEINARLASLPILFAMDSVALLPEEQRKLDEIGRLLEGAPRRSILVTGHTAIVGNEEGRRTISLWRAQVVAEYLIAQGLCGEDEITIEGLGADQPVVFDDSDQSANRRVEITIQEGEEEQEGGSIYD
jgi:outer membrane protein OmpA-like peptidoglycan-associated protein